MVVRALGNMSTLRGQRHVHTGNTITSKCKVVDKMVILRDIDASGSSQPSSEISLAAGILSAINIT